MGEGVDSQVLQLHLRCLAATLTSLSSIFLMAELLVLSSVFRRSCSSRRCHWGMGVLSTACQTQLRVKPHPTCFSHVLQCIITYIRKDAGLFGESLGGVNAGWGGA